MSSQPVEGCYLRASTPNQHTIHNEHLFDLWLRIHGEGKAQTLFYDGEVEDYTDFHYLLLEPSAMSYVLYRQETHEPLLLFWLNGFVGKAGQIHFCAFEAAGEQARELGSACARWLLDPQAGSGISALIGITPKPLRHAWKFALDVGFKKIIILPQACYMPRYGRHVDAVVTLYTSN